MEELPMSRKVKWLLGLILVLALASVGVAYGAWTQTLSLNGVAATGNINMQFWTGDDFLGATAPTGQPNTWLTHDNETTTEVGACTSASNGKSTTVTINMTNAYPGYECYVWVGPLDNGTVPVKLDRPTFASMPSWVEAIYAPNGPNPDDADFCYEDGYALNPGFGQQCKITFKVTDAAPQEANATFTGSVAVTQHTPAGGVPANGCFQAQ
jgi:hypothetical protein